eukprot:CAMPEP_0175165548 /NCGR_PEP_ID=MMETSP0087-20121206/27151_1 /TAXON_ID=136419 /ORGANISM="Unknown Unknown, Strain D1" /LENGTH=410 /DNA_ID=CAMNT_0016454945 /DNA_START=16 /DNA_END=1245 /DNA_ORIENTATION=-
MAEEAKDAGFCPCNILGDVKLGAGVTKSPHPEWYPPTEGVDMGLKVLNTLTGQLEPFRPGNGRRVLWYTCGPTVYDSCHMGHARAYLTFDILRRIMEDYFGYEVLYQINITDIDDKIILRSRRNKLLADYEAKNASDFATVLADVREALDVSDKKLTAGLQKLQQPLPAGSTSRDADERAEGLKTQQLKIKQLGTTRAKVAVVEAVASGSAEGVCADLVAEGVKLGLTNTSSEDVAKAVAAVQACIKEELQKERSAEEKFDAAPLELLDEKLSSLASAASGTVSALIAASNGELGAELDNKFGDKVTDHSVFESHARKFEKEYMEDMTRLGVKDPDVLTRVTEYVPEIIDYVKVIIDKGLAYESNGSVYLSIDDFKKQGHNYRKLDPSKKETSEADMAESEGALGSSASD